MHQLHAIRDAAPLGRVHHNVSGLLRQAGGEGAAPGRSGSDAEGHRQDAERAEALGHPRPGDIGQGRDGATAAAGESRAVRLMDSLLMSEARRRAHRILDRARSGEDVSAVLVTRALALTGDL